MATPSSGRRIKLGSVCERVNQGEAVGFCGEAGQRRMTDIGTGEGREEKEDIAVKQGLRFKG